MNKSSTPWLVGLVLLVFAIPTRLYRIDWSVSGDHTTMLNGVRGLREKPFTSLEGLSAGELQSRYLPLSYFLQGLAFDTFGWDEAGSRTGSAVVGAITIALVGVVVSRLYGVVNGVIVGTSLLLCAWILMHHQGNRHYSYALFFGSTSLLMTADAWRKNTWARGALAGLLTALAVGILPVLLLLPCAVAVFMFIEIALRRSSFPRSSMIAYWAVCVPLTVCGMAPFVWFMSTYERSFLDWGSTPWRSVAGLFFNLGFSVAAFAAVGWVRAVSKGDVTERLCAAIAATSLAACLIMPIFGSFKHDYVLPLTLAMFLLASRTVTIMHDAVVQVHGRAFAAAMAAAILLIPLPSLASYYQDGDRKDYRAAANFIRENMREGDIVSADTIGALGYYLDCPVEEASRLVTRPRRSIERLTKLISTGRRVWYVLRFSRDDTPLEADRWLWHHAIRMKRIRHKRFDYHVNLLDIYLFNPTQEDLEHIRAHAEGSPTSTAPRERPG